MKFAGIFIVSSLLFFIPADLAAQDPFKLIDHLITLRNRPSFTLKIPATYRISVATEGLERPRFFSKSPDGRLFVTDMHDRGDNKLGRILILENWNDSLKRFDVVTTFLDSLHNPNQIAFYSKAGNHYIYVAETGKLSYYKYLPGSNTTDPATTIASFPDYGLSYKYGGWHLTRSIAIHNDKLYVSVGSSCDACIEKEDVRATILEMNMDGTDQRIFARGLRNSVGIKWINDSLWVTSMGRDNRGPDKPEELFHTVQKENFYGWPYYFQYKRQIIADEAFKDSIHPAYVKRPPLAPWAFKAHTAPLGFDYLTGFIDPQLDNSFIVALHGSTSVWRERGNAVVQLLPKGRYREILTGFLQGKQKVKDMDGHVTYFNGIIIHSSLVTIRME